MQSNALFLSWLQQCTMMQVRMSEGHVPHRALARRCFGGHLQSWSYACASASKSWGTTKGATPCWRAVALHPAPNDAAASPSSGASEASRP